jgi:hypothetical protein
MSLLGLTALMFSLVGLVFAASTDEERARLGVVMVVSGWVFAWIAVVIWVQP